MSPKANSHCDHAHQHLLKGFCNDAKALSLIKFTGQQYLRKRPRLSLLETLCRAISGQQLSTKAAATIWGRVKAGQSAEDTSFLNFIIQTDSAQLRTFGLSNAKSRAVKELAQAAESGRLNAKRLATMPADEQIDQLCEFWGVGRWTAQMCAISYFTQPDVWSEGDVGLKNALTALYPDSPDAQLQAVQIASPFRTYWSLHLWSALDNGFFNLTNESE